MRYIVIDVGITNKNTPYMIEDTETGRPICLCWNQTQADLLCTLLNENTKE